MVNFVCRSDLPALIVNLGKSLNSLRTDGDRLLSPRAGHRNCPKNIRLSKHTDMTIHWKAI
jgi:hypothetical protein